MVVLVADDRSQSRDVAQSQDDEAETMTMPRRRRRRPHRPPRCFGAGLLHRERERAPTRNLCVEIQPFSKDTKLLLDLSPIRV